MAMYPIALDVTRLRIALIGQGEAFTRRKDALREAGALHVTLYENIPDAQDIARAQIVMVVGLDEANSALVAGMARARGIVVNVEDKPDLCDFYFMSMVRRGELTLAVSTGGASPTLAQEIKAYLGDIFGEEWEGIVAQIAAQRLAWKREGLDNPAVGERTRAWIGVNAPAPLGHSNSICPHPGPLPAGEGVKVVLPEGEGVDRKESA